MDQKFKTIVNGTFEFSLQTNDLEHFDVIADHRKHNAIFNHKSLSIETLAADFNNRNYTVAVNGNRYEVKIENGLDALIANMGLSLGNDSIHDEIHAPMPGMILEVNVAEGDEVKKGDFLCVLEAMKMENTLSAPRDGIIKSVNISKGETVDKGKLLLELEKND